MHDPGLVRRGQSFSDLRRDIDDTFERQALAIHFSPKRLAVDQFRDEILSLALRTDIVDGKDVGMVERACRDRFLREPALSIRIRGGMIVKDFDGDKSLETTVPGAIDLSHSAGAKGADDLVGAEVRGQLRHTMVWIRDGRKRYCRLRSTVNGTTTDYLAMTPMVEPYTSRDFAPCSHTTALRFGPHSLRIGISLSSVDGCSERTFTTCNVRATAT